MVMRLAIAALFCSAVTISCAADRCTKGTEFEPPLCPLVLPEIVEITILENAMKSAAETDPAISCADFLLTGPAIRRFLALAKLTNANDAHHTLDWSPCYATGELRLSDGRAAKWRFDQYRSGTIAIGKDPEMVVYCPKCRFKPFQ